MVRHADVLSQKVGGLIGMSVSLLDVTIDGVKLTGSIKGLEL